MGVHGLGPKGYTVLLHSSCQELALWLSEKDLRVPFSGPDVCQLLWYPDRAGLSLSKRMNE